MPFMVIVSLYVRKRFVLGSAFSLCVAVYAFHNSMKDTYYITRFYDTIGQNLTFM